VSAPVPATRPGLSRSPFPEGLVLAPVSRRPTRLEDATLRVLLDRDVPALRPGPARAPEASVVVVTRDNLPFLRLCLESVLAYTEAPIEVVVVDNASGDGTAPYLALLRERNPCVRVVSNGENRSFAAACNQGAELATGDVLVFANDDVAVTPAWLDRLRTHLADPAVGMAGPVTNRTGNEAQVDSDYRTWGELLRFAEARAERHAGEAFDVPTLTMFCVAMRRALYERVGPLDERFETGLLEDDDYSRRVRAAGFRLLCADDAFVHHFGEASFGKLVASGEYGRVLAANRARYEKKWGEAWRPYGRRKSDRYRALAERLRRAVADAVPEGAVVLVASRGDDDLLAIPGRDARHFPREGEVYAGRHPADSEEAIRFLEAERSDGAGYLVIPDTASWWLEHYAGLRRHLERRYRQSGSVPGVCAIFDLRGAAT